MVLFCFFLFAKVNLVLALWVCVCVCAYHYVNTYTYVLHTYLFFKLNLATRISVIVCVYNQREQKSRISFQIFSSTIKFIRTFLTVYKNILKWPEVKRWRYAFILRVVTIRVKILISDQQRIAIDISIFLVIGQNNESILATLFQLVVGGCFKNLRNSVNIHFIICILSI